MTAAPTNTPADAIAAGLVTAIDHVGIAVPDLDAAAQWYHTYLGMVVTHEETNAEQGVREAMLGYAPSPDNTAPNGTALQLLAPLDSSSTIAKFIDRNGPGLQQLAYRVTDLQTVSNFLRERGVRLLYDAGKRGTGGSLINFIHPKDAGGVLIELVEPSSDHERVTSAQNLHEDR